MSNLVTMLFQNREDPGDEVGERPTDWDLS